MDKPPKQEQKMSFCNWCGQWISQENYIKHLGHHVDVDKIQTRWHCSQCGSSFKSNDDLFSHREIVVKAGKTLCDIFQERAMKN